MGNGHLSPDEGGRWIDEGGRGGNSNMPSMVERWSLKFRGLVEIRWCKKVLMWSRQGRWSAKRDSKGD